MTNYRLYKRLCPQCGISFFTSQYNRKYCCDDCLKTSRLSYKTRHYKQLQENKNHLSIIKK